MTRRLDALMDLNRDPYPPCRPFRALWRWFAARTFARHRLTVPGPQPGWTYLGRTGPGAAIRGGTSPDVLLIDDPAFAGETTFGPFGEGRLIIAAPGTPLPWHREDTRVLRDLQEQMAAIWAEGGPWADGTPRDAPLHTPDHPPDPGRGCANHGLRPCLACDPDTTGPLRAIPPSRDGDR